MNQILSFILLFCLGTFTYGQLSPFTISLTTTSETCAGNGTMEITSSGLTSGTTTIYSIYLLPNETTPIHRVQTTTINGLVAGDYKVIAIQSSANYSNRATANATVALETTDVNFSFEDVRQVACDGGGGFTVNVASGTSPYQYQILDENNEVTQSQSDPIFSDLKEGQYKIRVLDACGIGRVKTISITQVDIEATDTFIDLSQSTASCNSSIQARENFNASRDNILELSKTLTVSFTNPITNQIETVTRTRSETNFNGNTMEIKLPISTFPGYTITYDWSITDRCGTRSGTFDAFNYYREREITGYEILLDQCKNSNGFQIETTAVQTPVASNATGITFTDVPVGMDKNNIDADLNRNLNSSTTLHKIRSRNTEIPLLAGIYRGYFTMCDGEELPFEYDYQLVSSSVDWDFNYVGTNVSKFCNFLNESFEYRSVPSINTVNLINPASTGTFGYSRLGYNITLSFYNYPEGSYQVEFIDSCGRSTIESITTSTNYPEYIPGTINVESVCGGFNLHPGSAPQPMEIVNDTFYYLQFYDKNLGGWTTPRTDYYQSIYVEGDAIGLQTGYMIPKGEGLPNYSALPNLHQEGKFRIMEQKQERIYNGKGRFLKYEYCHDIINEFENRVTPIFSEVYTYKCSNGTYNIGLSVNGGSTPYTYQIVANPDSSEVDNIILDNGGNNLFVDLVEGKYYLRVIDSCGNVNTEEFDILDLGIPKIITRADCNTQEIDLELIGVDYLSFEWYRENESNVILSTTNSLTLGTIEPEDVGTYFVHIVSEVSGSCIDEIISVSISDDPFANPNAGQDFTLGPVKPQPIDLVDLIIENNQSIDVDSDGSFELIFADGQNEENSGQIIDNIWYADQADEGTYQIKYRVDGLCGLMDEAIITIINRNVCVKLPSTAPSAEHPPIGISTLNRGDDSINWLNGYNDGWIALESRTKGFVITRADDPNHPENTINNPVEGMLVFDIDENCMKLYDGTKWGCIYRGCDENVSP